MAINEPYKKIEWDDSWNNFSFWFPKIEGCGMKVPISTIIPAPDKEYYMHCYMEQSEEDMAYFYAFAKNTVIPKMHEAGISLPFIKNATFSNKFNAATCMPAPGAMEIAVAIANINYEALCVGADGLTEIVVRERIQSNPRKTPTIYNGLPLRPEFRVFYDFESHLPLYTANYWDYDYVYPHLHDVTDKLIFDSRHAYIDKVFSQRKDEIQALVAKSMKNVQGLCGQWSVDVMLDDNGDPWLIDMAVAQRSAYWRELEEAKKKAAERHRAFSADTLVEAPFKGETMHVKEAKEILDAIIANGHGDDPLLINTDDKTVGTSGFVQITAIYPGFDWESGQVRIQPQESLVRETKTEG